VIGRPHSLRANGLRETSAASSSCCTAFGGQAYLFNDSKDAPRGFLFAAIEARQDNVGSINYDD
jgi:hypothetical protein